jgi:hypothetical protein
MKRLALIFATGVTAAVLAVVVTASGQGQHKGQQDVYFGYLLATPRLAGVAFDLTAPDKNGTRTLRAYVCDGLGVPDGMAVWFKGLVPAKPQAEDFPLEFTSVSGQETLTITVLSDGRVLGAFTEASGDRSPFAAYPAIDGAGIYQVTLDANLHYKGTSTDGAILDAQADGQGTTIGTIKPANGNTTAFTVHSLALAPPAALASHGLSEDYYNYTAFNQVPGSYVAVIAPGGSHWFGRSGAVQAGSPGLMIISLDKKDVR